MVLFYLLSVLVALVALGVVLRRSPVPRPVPGGPVVSSPGEAEVWVILAARLAPAA